MDDILKWISEESKMTIYENPGLFLGTHIIKKKLEISL